MTPSQREDEAAERGLTLSAARQSTQAFYEKNHWPFTITSNPFSTRATAPVVWSTWSGFRVHQIQEEKKTLNKNEKAILWTMFEYDVEGRHGMNTSKNMPKGWPRSMSVEALESLHKRGLVRRLRIEVEGSHFYRISPNGIAAAKRLA